MQDIDSGKTSETNDKIEHHISNNLKGLNEQSRNYIKDIVSLINKEIGINKIVSILLFGSQQVEKKIRLFRIVICFLSLKIEFQAGILKKSRGILSH